MSVDSAGNPSIKTALLAPTFALVLRLIIQLPTGPRFCIYLDNFFLNIPMAQCLLAMGVYYPLRGQWVQLAHFLKLAHFFPIKVFEPHRDQHALPNPHMFNHQPCYGHVAIFNCLRDTESPHCHDYPKSTASRNDVEFTLKRSIEMM
jgi:hypothetical protein